MKKLFALILTVLIICSCSITAFAENKKFNTAGDLYQAWYDDLPDYICGVWSTDGGSESLTFGIQNNEAGNAGKQEMLELIKNDSTITFVYQTFSRNYLLQIQDELIEYFEKDLGLVSAALDEQNNRIVLGVYEQRKEESATKSMIKELVDKYGKAVSVEYTDQIVSFTIGNEAPYMQLFLYVVPGIAAVFLVGVILIMVRKRNAMLLQTANGTTVVTSNPLTAKEVEGMVKKSCCCVPADLDQKVMNTIDNQLK